MSIMVIFTTIFPTLIMIFLCIYLNFINVNNDTIIVENPIYNESKEPTNEMTIQDQNDSTTDSDELVELEDR
jgi:hypothetical protein